MSIDVCLGEYSMKWRNVWRTMRGGSRPGACARARHGVSCWAHGFRKSVKLAGWLNAETLCIDYSYAEWRPAVIRASRV